MTNVTANPRRLEGRRTFCHTPQREGANGRSRLRAELEERALASFLHGRAAGGAIVLPGEVFIDGKRVVAALVRHGFVVYRAAPAATICERGLRAVAVPRAIRPESLPEILRMTGLPADEIGAIRADVERAATVFRPLTAGRSVIAPTAPPSS